MARPEIRTPARNPSPEWLKAWDLVDQIEDVLKALRYSKMQGVALSATLILRDALSDLRDEED